MSTRGTGNLAQDRWTDSPPSPSGVLDADADLLADYTRHGEELLAALPPKADRDAQELRHANAVHGACRRARSAFLRAHADAVYDRLTGGREDELWLGELAFAAAEAFPGLVPDRTQLAQEQQHLQADKEGREIDQGLFFQALLGRDGVADHLGRVQRRPTERALGLADRFAAEGTAELGTVSVQRRGASAHVTISNLRYLNAEDDALVDDLETAVDLVLLDDRTRVGVLRGAEMTHPKYAGRRVFSAGINLLHLHQGRISFVDFLLRRELGFINKIARGLSEHGRDAGWDPEPLEKPWIAVVDGFAIGGGMQLLLVFDRVIAADDAYFSLPAAQEGIIPGAANLRLSRLTGARLAKRIVLNGHRIWAADAEAGLICDEIVPTRELDAVVRRAAEELDQPAVVPNRRMLRLADEPLAAFHGYMSAFAGEQARRLYSADVLAKARARAGDR